LNARRRRRAERRRMLLHAVGRVTDGGLLLELFVVESRR
jgi:hypothetical protein